MTEKKYSVKKHIGGVFDWENYVKVTVFLACFFVLCLIGYGGYSIYEYFKPKKLTPDITNVSESGTANIDKSNTSVVHYHLPLSDLFSFGSKNKINNKD